MTQRPLLDYLSTFGFGYFFGLGSLALLHFLIAWPSSYQAAAVMALISGIGAVGARLYNRRVVRPTDED